jgi:hypothetical protein
MSAQPTRRRRRVLALPMSRYDITRRHVAHHGRDHGVGRRQRARPRGDASHESLSRPIQEPRHSSEARGVRGHSSSGRWQRFLGYGFDGYQHGNSTDATTGRPPWKAQTQASSSRLSLPLGLPQASCQGRVQKNGRRNFPRQYPCSFRPICSIRIPNCWNRPDPGPSSIVIFLSLRSTSLRSTSLRSTSLRSSYTESRDNPVSRRSVMRTVRVSRLGPTTARVGLRRAVSAAKPRSSLNGFA